MNSLLTESNLTQFFADHLVTSGFSETTSLLIAFFCFLFLFATSVAILIWVRRRYLKEMFSRITSRTRFSWDDMLAKHGFFSWGANIGIAILFITLAGVMFGGLIISGLPVGKVITTACNVYLIIAVLFFLDSGLNAGLGFYQKLPVSKDVDIKGFVQALKLILMILGLVFVASTILGRSPLFLLSGIGALTAVFLLIFKDAILGFVAGIQISVNKTVRVGDWVEMPSHLADGDVIDISLTTVKIQNWDKTITSIPTYDLISRPFKNWRGMSESGGRRIKRAIHLDMNTIRFADAEMIEDFKSISLIKPYVESKLEEIAAFNKENGITDQPKNGRSITNVGTFRAYCLAYLRAYPKLRNDMTFLVRQLAPSSKGLPLEIYVFTNDTRWVSYEDIQSDIFDHLLAILPTFKLGVFQEPTGNDFAGLKD
jgi:miniconductance mechanosensitive channel